MATRTTYRVQQGDTLKSISKRLLGDENRFQELGYSGDPNNLAAGTVLNIPGSSNRQPQNAPSQQAMIPDAYKQIIPELSNKPQSPDQVQGYLDTLQFGLLDQFRNESGVFKNDNQIATEIKEITATQQQRPTAPNLVETFMQARKSEGLQDLEDELKLIGDQKQSIIDQYIKDKNDLSGERVIENVRSGRIGQLGQEAQEAISLIESREATIKDQIQIKFKIVDTITSLTGEDFNNALKSYESELNEKLSLYDRFQSASLEERKFKTESIAALDKLNLDRADKAATLQQKQNETTFDQNLKIAEYQSAEQERLSKTARANLEIIGGYIKDGNMDVQNLPADLQIQIGKLEVMSGLGVGFLSNIMTQNPGAKIHNTHIRKLEDGSEVADVIMQTETGQLKVQTLELGRNYEKPADATRFNQDDFDTALTFLEEADANQDKMLSREEAQKAAKRMIAYVGDEALGAKLFDDAMVQFEFQPWKW